MKSTRQIISSFLSYKIMTLNSFAFQCRFISTSKPVYRYRDYEQISVSNPHEHVLHVQLNQPDKRNALNRAAIHELNTAFQTITDDQHCRAVVLSGLGKMFCSGVDVVDFVQTVRAVTEPTGESINAGERTDIAGKAKFLRDLVKTLQAPFNSMANCPKPVIAAIHSGCMGAGISMISAVDVRYASKDAYFSVREVGIGIAGGMGSLQRLPKIMGSDSLVRELAFTGKNISADEAKKFGLVSQIFDTKEKCLAEAFELAQEIASKSPLAVQGSKMSLNYSRNHTIEEGLKFMQYWNMTMRQSDEVTRGLEAAIENKDEDSNLDSAKKVYYN